MSKSDHLAAYAEGWTNGDTAKIISALAENYVLDDPNHGQVSKGGMAEFLDGMKAVVSELRGGREESTFLNLTEVVADDSGDVLTAWCWWEVPGTPIAGAGLIKVRDDGVQSERLTYYTKLPE
jgi:hypothetical protein